MQMIPDIRTICPNGLNVIPERIEFMDELIRVEFPCDICADKRTCQYAGKLAVYGSYPKKSKNASTINRKNKNGGTL